MCMYNKIVYISLFLIVMFSLNTVVATELTNSSLDEISSISEHEMDNLEVGDCPISVSDS